MAIESTMSGPPVISPFPGYNKAKSHTGNSFSPWSPHMSVGSLLTHTHESSAEGDRAGFDLSQVTERNQHPKNRL